MDREAILRHNQRGWDLEVENGNRWTVPVSSETVAAAREGRWEIILTPTKPVPREWYPELRGLDVLCLASGGGQQGPILAAAGAKVTVFDQSPRQLAQDRMVAERDGLSIATVEGDMADLSVFPDGSFGLIVHPISNVFAAEVRPVWREAFRVLRPGGVLLAGFHNPFTCLFDPDQEAAGVLQVRYAMPYSDLTSITEEERRRRFGEHSPLEFCHTLTDQIGGQLDAGFHLTAFFEDYDPDTLVSTFMPSSCATRAVRP